MSKVLLIFLLASTVIFALGFAAVVCVYATQLSDLIPVENCSRSAAPYGVIPGVNAPITRCQELGNDVPCTFPASTLGQAITKCDSDATRCLQFIWTGSEISYVSNGIEPTNLDSNVYIRQN